ncbi:MAG: pyridoxal phosphate-dependent aminotransferase [Dehalococcoidia bacterium]|nr:pyridoxal phosphate-dependent aminotransferase [Dehalococcoidia bacterium]
MKLAKRMSRLGTETAFEVLAKAKILEAEGVDVIHLEIGEPDFDTPENVINAGSTALLSGYTRYGPSPGLSELRDKIADEISSTRKIPVSSENVVVTPGGKPIIFFCALALIEPGDEVLYPNPGFPIYESMINFAGGTPVPMKLHEELDFSFDIDEVINQVTDNTKMIIINSPNNPCGSVIPNSDLEALARVAIDKDLIILSDEIYSRYLYEGSHQSITKFPGLQERTVILDGFSKTYAMTGWRIGYGIMPIPLVEPISRLMTNSVSCTASFTQIAAIEALTGSQEEANKMVLEFKNRRNTIVNGLNQINGISCKIPKGAFYAFPNIKGTGLSSKTFADDLLQKAGVASLNGESFGEFGKDYIRLSFANSTENILEALNRIESFVKKL